MAESIQSARKTVSPLAAFARVGETLKSGEIALALGIVCILVVLILPMPRWLLDISLALSMTLLLRIQ